MSESHFKGKYNYVQITHIVRSCTTSLFSLILFCLFLSLILLLKSPMCCQEEVICTGWIILKNVEIKVLNCKFYSFNEGETKTKATHIWLQQSRRTDPGNIQSLRDV